jgi:type I restriction enzyme S subunit
MSKLPTGWDDVSFMDIFDIQGGTQPPKKEFIYHHKNGYIRLLQIRDFGDKPLATYIPFSKNLKRCNKDDILIGRYGASVGRICTGMEGAYNVALAKVIISSIFCKKFIYFLLKSDLFQKPILSTERSAQDGFNKEDLSQIIVSIPPANEQRRIVAKLEKLLAKVDTCKERLDKIPGILKRFRQSVLSAACSGRLTADWRENNPDVESAEELLKRIHIERRRRWEEVELETISANGKIPKDDKWKFRYKEPEPVNVEDLPKLPNNWHWTSLQSIAVVKDPNPSHRYPSYEDGTVPLLSTREFRGLNDWQTELSPLVSEEVYQFQNKICEFSTNDIIFARKGKLGLARRPPKLPKYTFSHTIFIIKCFEGICSDSILWYLRQDKAVEWLLREMNSNTGVPTLGKAVTEQLPIPLAPIAEQQEIVNRVQHLFKTADQIEQRYQKAKSYIDQLTQSILAKAFRGELVPQDPNDEPASVLVERIRAERENRENVAKTAKKPAVNKKQRSKKAQPQLEPTPPLEPTRQSEPIQLELPLFD